MEITVVNETEEKSEIYLENNVIQNEVVNSDDPVSSDDEGNILLR